MSVTVTSGRTYNVFSGTTTTEQRRQYRPLRLKLLTRDEARRNAGNIAKLPDLFLFEATAGKRGVTRLQPHTHDVRAMSACTPTADVSLRRGDDATGPGCVERGRYEGRC